MLYEPDEVGYSLTDELLLNFVTIRKKMKLIHCQSSRNILSSESSCYKELKLDQYNFSLKLILIIISYYVDE